MDENKATYFFLGIGLGVAVGMLFAPTSGQEARNMIRSRAGEGKEYLRRRGGELADSASDVMERGKSVVGRQRDQVSAAMEAGKQAYREATSTSSMGDRGPVADNF